MLLFFLHFQTNGKKTISSSYAFHLHGALPHIWPERLSIYMAISVPEKPVFSRARVQGNFLIEQS